LKDAASVFMGLDTSTGTITTKSGQKEIDIRKLVREISVSDSDALEFVWHVAGAPISDLRTSLRICIRLPELIRMASGSDTSHWIVFC